MRDIKRIIVHCSASNYGTAAVIDEWHKKRGWRGIGYHYVILNGFRANCGAYSRVYDGRIEPGRDVKEIGAHVKGHNRDSLGICLIGTRLFTAQQLIGSLPSLITNLMSHYDLGLGDVYGHNDFCNKECPGFDLGSLLRMFHRCGVL